MWRGEARRCRARAQLGLLALLSLSSSPEAVCKHWEHLQGLDTLLPPCVAGNLGQKGVCGEGSLELGPSCVGTLSGQ